MTRMQGGGESQNSGSGAEESNCRLVEFVVDDCRRGGGVGCVVRLPHVGCDTVVMLQSVDNAGWLELQRGRRLGEIDSLQLASSLDWGRRQGGGAGD